MNVKGNPIALKMSRGGHTSQESWPAFQKRRGCKGELENENKEQRRKANTGHQGVLRQQGLVPAGPASHKGNLCGDTGPHVQKGPVLGSAVTILKFLIIVKEGAPRFHCALGPTNYAASPISSSIGMMTLPPGQGCC